MAFPLFAADIQRWFAEYGPLFHSTMHVTFHRFTVHHMLYYGLLPDTQSKSGGYKTRYTVESAQIMW